MKRFSEKLDQIKKKRAIPEDEVFANSSGAAYKN